MRILRALVLSSLTCGLLSFPQASGGVGARPEVAGSPWRLPDACQVQAYDLTVTPDLAKFTFAGQADMTLVVKRPTGQIVLNQHDLRISKAVISAAGKAAQTGSVVADDKHERVLINFASRLAPGSYKLKLTYSGILNDQLAGFYRSSFKDASGKTRYLAATQMEPTDARRMFPCFDEPDRKATFKLTVNCDADLACVSNAPVESETALPGGKRKVVSFAETPPMSTYLVALVVGPLEATEPVVVEGTPIRVWSVKGKIGLGQYALKTAVRELPFFNKYFGIAYPWKKLDLIAIPDFAAGAMENPGAITFRERILLADEKNASQDQLRGTAETIAHEIAHMWFGDLVTMKWWDDLWLNEAFATWFAIKVVDNVFPEWDYGKEYVQARLQAMDTDSLLSTRPIQAPVGNPDDAMQMFDVITYQKGASVLRMLEAYVSEAKFAEGVQRYMKEHSYGNATTGDLWQAIQAVSGVPVQAIMRSWVNQPGYPLVTVGQAGEKETQLSLAQRRFLIGKGKAVPAIYEVPVGTRALGAERSATGWHLLAGSSATVEAQPGVNFANANATGFYRVKYGGPLSEAIAKRIGQDGIAAERLALLSDQFALVRTGDVPVAQYLALLKQYDGENDDAVLTNLIGDLNYMSDFLQGPAAGKFAQLVRKRLGGVHERLGWSARPQEKPSTGIARAEVIATLGTIGENHAVVKRARELFQRYRQDHNSVEPDLVSAVFRIVSYTGGAAEYEQMMQLYAQAKTPEEELRSLYSLGGFRSPALIQRTLELAISGKVRSQDAPHLLGRALAGKDSGDQAWQFMKKNWTRINKVFPDHFLPRMVSAGSTCNQPARAKDMRMFFASHPIKAGESQVNRMLERVDNNLAFRATVLPHLLGYLNSSQLAGDSRH